MLRFFPTLIFAKGTSHDEIRRQVASLCDGDYAVAGLADGKVISVGGIQPRWDAAEDLMGMSDWTQVALVTAEHSRTLKDGMANKGLSFSYF